jgi:hypothetical protein
MYDYEFLYKQLVSRYGEQGGLHSQMRELNQKAEVLTYDEYFSQMKHICKSNVNAYHVYFDKYMKWYDKIGIKICPKSEQRGVQSE